mmetsp:Transcript_15014/g.37811  ORF Transcript_15014/g.37811 Transcript_15014/m.37811 type:complete len:123 (+) Transcript_15014:156-524(+)
MKYKRFAKEDSLLQPFGIFLCGLGDSVAGECPGANTTSPIRVAVGKVRKTWEAGIACGFFAEEFRVGDFLWNNIWLCSSVGSSVDTLGDLFHDTLGLELEEPEEELLGEFVEFTADFGAVTT